MRRFSLFYSVNLCCIVVSVINAFFFSRKFFVSRSVVSYSTTERVANYDIESSFQPNEISTELPLDFDDSIDRAVAATLRGIQQGKYRMRIDFDTSIGDQTYTSIKNTMPVVKEMVKKLSIKMNMLNINEGERESTLRIFFPDMGAAVLARRDWKMGTAYKDENKEDQTGAISTQSSEDVDNSDKEPVVEAVIVPSCIRAANIQNDPLEPTDKLAMILCPQYSETDYVKRVMDMCDFSGVPVVMVNPQLINMDQGYGVRARNIRKTLINSFSTVYKLKTLKTGAIVKEYPYPYTVWGEDSTADGGYKLLKTFESDPTIEEVDELFDDEAISTTDGDGKSNKNNSKAVGNAVLKTVTGIVDFFQGLSKL
eukprot:gene28774-37775_t